MTARAIVLLVGAASASRRLEISQTGPTTPKNTGDGCSPYISNDVAPWQTDNGGLALKELCEGSPANAARARCAGRSTKWARATAT